MAAEGALFHKPNNRAASFIVFETATNRLGHETLRTRQVCVIQVSKDKNKKL